MGKRGWWVVALIVVVAAGVVGWRMSAGRSKAPSFRTDVIRRGDIKVQVSATGTLNAVTTVQVGSQVSGTISHLYVDFNDKVKKNQILAQLDPTFLKEQVEQSEADLNNAVVHVRQAQRDSARTFALGAQGLASQADLDNAQTTLDAARASARSSQSGVDRARTNLQYATISSPIDGVVVSRAVDVGQTVAASLSAPTLYTIANDLTQMELDASVDEADIGQVQVAQPVTFTVDAYPDLSFRGEVHQIRLSSATVQNVVTYTVVIYVNNPDLKLLPGMTANLTILVDQARDVLNVPSLALRFRPPQVGGRRGGARGATAQAASASGAAAGAGPGAARDGEGGSPRAEHTAPGGTPGAERGGPGGGHGGPGGENRARFAAANGGGTEGGPAGQHHGPQGDASTTSGGKGEGEPSAEVRQVPTGTVYVLDSQHHPHQVRVRTGASDGTYTAVYTDSLREGDTVILAMDSAGGSAGNQVVNPFAPRFGGGGRR